MERYDGKTRKDDYIKYTLIAAALVVAIVGLSMLTSCLMHTAVSGGSRCGGQRQRCGDSGSGLR